MPDSNLVSTAIQSHTAALGGAVQRHSANAVRCKVWSAGIMAGAFFFTPGKAQMTALPWLLGVFILLALADACCVAMARAATEACNAFMRKLPLNGGNVPKPEEWLNLPAPDPGLRQAGPVLRAIGSFSVWPFYGAMLALGTAFYVQATAEAARLAAKTAPRPSQAAPVSALLPMKPGPLPASVSSQPGGAGSPSGPRAMPPTQPRQPGQPPTFSPINPTQPPPGARPLAAPTGIRTPPPGIPAKPPMPAGAPQNAVPPPTGAPVPNGVPHGSAAPVPATGALPPPGTGSVPPAAPRAPTDITPPSEDVLP